MCGHARWQRTYVARLLSRELCGRINATDGNTTVAANVAVTRPIAAMISESERKEIGVVAVAA